MARYIKTVSATGVSTPDPLTGDGALICGAYSWEPISVCCNWSTNLSNGCIYLTGNFGEYDSLIFEVNSFGHNCCCLATCGTICFSSPNCTAYCHVSACCPALCSWTRIPVGHFSTCSASHCVLCKCHIEMPVYVCCGSTCGYGSFHVRFDRGTRLGGFDSECYSIRAESTVTPRVFCNNNQAEQYLWTTSSPPTSFNYYWPEKDGAPAGNEWSGIHFTLNRSIMCPAFTGAKFGIWGQRRSKYPSANITSE